MIFFLKVFLVVLSVQLLYLYLSDKFLIRKLSGTTAVYGLPGTGKTTLASRYSYEVNKYGFKCFSNFPLQGAYTIDVSDLGVWDVSDGCLVVDEAGIDYSNRKILEKKMKGIQEENRKWWKLHRHYGCSNILVLSQSQDFDIFIRRLCERRYIITEFDFLGMFSNWSKLVPLDPYWDVSDDGLEPVVKLRIHTFFYAWFNRKPFYNTFDSWEAPPLPKKEFPFVDPIEPNFKDKRLINKARKNLLDYNTYLLESGIDN